MRRDYRPFGVPVPVSPEESEIGVTRVTADGSLLDADGHYVTCDDDADV